MTTQPGRALGRVVPSSPERCGCRESIHPVQAAIRGPVDDATQVVGSSWPVEIDIADRRRRRAQPTSSCCRCRSFSFNYNGGLEAHSGVSACPTRVLPGTPDPVTRNVANRAPVRPMPLSWPYNAHRRHRSLDQRPWARRRSSAPKIRPGLVARGGAARRSLPLLREREVALSRGSAAACWRRSEAAAARCSRAPRLRSRGHSAGGPHPGIAAAIPDGQDHERVRP